MNLEQYKKKMKCVKTKFEHIGQNTQGKAVFDWYVDWKRGIVFAVTKDVTTGEERICHLFEYMAGCNLKFSNKSIDDYTTEVKQLDGCKIEIEFI